MACETQTDKFVRIVEKLLSLDADRYKNFDKAAEFILKGPLTPEQKKLSLHNIAHIYSGLYRLDADTFELGKADEVIKAVNLLDNTANYIDFANKLFGTKALTGMSESALRTRLNEFTKLSFVTVPDLIGPEGILTFLESFVKANTFPSPEAQQEFVNSIASDIKEAISKMAKVPDGARQSYFSLIDSKLENAGSQASRYIPLSEIEEFADLDNYILLLDNNVFVEAVKYEDGFYLINSQGELEKVQEDKIVMSKEARPTNRGLGNKGEQVFYEDELLSGLTIQGVNPSETLFILDALSKMSSPAAGVEITAVKLSDIGDNRVQRMQQMAADDPKMFGQLSKRKHETFESAAQERLLQSDPNAKVLSVSRPKQSEQQFALMGKIKGTDLLFYIYPLDNFAFVSADNTTELVDFQNPGHLNEVKRLSVLEKGGMRQEMTNADLRNISHAQKAYSDMKSKVFTKVQSAFDKGETAVDITNEFLGSYNINQVRNKATKTVLSKALESSPNLGLKVEVVDIDPTTGAIVPGSEKSISLPFFYTKKIDYTTANVDYVLNSFLPSGKMIKVTAPDGSVNAISQEEYANSILKMEEFFTTAMKEQDDQIRTKLEEDFDPANPKPVDLSSISKTSNFLISFGMEGEMKIVNADPAYAMSAPEQFAKFMSTLGQALYQDGKKILPTQRSINMRKIDKQVYTFQGALRDKTGAPKLSLGFFTDKAGNLQFEIRPWSTSLAENNEFVDIMKAAGNTPFNFSFGEMFEGASFETIFMDIFKELANGQLVNEVVNENLSFQVHDRTTPNGIMKFYEELYYLANPVNEPTTKIKELVSHVEKQMGRFNTILEKAVLDKLKDGTKGTPEFMEALKANMTFKDEFRIEYLLFQPSEDGKMTPKVYFARTNAEGIEQFTSSLKNVLVINSNPRKVSIIPKTPVGVSPQDAEASSKKEITDGTEFETIEERQERLAKEAQITESQNINPTDSIEEEVNPVLLPDVMAAPLVVEGYVQIGDRIASFSLSKDEQGEREYYLNQDDPSRELPELIENMKNSNESISIMEYTYEDGTRAITLLVAKDSNGQDLKGRGESNAGYAVSITIPADSTITVEDVMPRLQNRVNEVNSAITSFGYLAPIDLPDENYNTNKEDIISDKIDDIIDESKNDPYEDDSDVEDFERFSIIPNQPVEQATSLVKGYIKALYEKFDNFKDALKSQKSDARIAYDMLIDSVVNKKRLTASEKDFIGTQLRDALKLAGFGVAAALPGGSIYFILAKTAALKQYLTPSKMLTNAQIPKSMEALEPLDPNIEPAAEWLATALPMFGLNVSDLQDVVDLSKIDGRVLGLFKDKVIHLNEQLKNKGTIYHEAFHGVFRYLLTADERKNLTGKIMSDKRYKKRFSPEALQEFARVRKFRYDYDKMAELVAEEILAENFQTYMEKADAGKEPAPKTILQKLFATLRKLINMIRKNSDYIDSMYGKIRSGGFSNAVITSEIYKGQVAFELIPGVVKYYRNEQGAVARNTTNMNTKDSSQLVNMVTGIVFSDESNDTFEKKFERAVELTLNEIYNIENLTAQVESEEDKQDLIRRYGPMYQNFRFALGARFKGLTGAEDINYTDDETRSNKKTQNLIFRIGQDHIDNTNGEHSYKILKKLVKKKVDAVNNMRLVRETLEEDPTVNIDDIEKINSEENVNERDNDLSDAREEVESGDFDKGFNEYDIMDSYVAQVRRFLSTIRQDFTDDRTGAKVPKMIDGEVIFPILLKVTANLDVTKTIPAIKSIAQTMMRDGFTQAAEEIMAVYNEIDKLTKLDSEGNPQDNKQLYNQIINVMNNVELDYSMFRITMPELIETQEDAQNARPATQKPLSFTLTDRVIEADVVSKRNEIITNILKFHSERPKSEKYKKEYQEALNTLKKLSEQITKVGNENILGSVTGQTMKLRELSTKMHDAMTTLGMTIPKSLLELSLMAIHQSENRQMLTVDKDLQDFYSTNEQFIRQAQYLEKDFFLSLSNVLSQFYSGPGVPNANLKNILDDEFSKNTDIQRFMLILKKASSYIVKYDPTQLPSVIKNAEGKSIYRFAKYTPMHLIAQSIREVGLEKTLEQNPYYADFLKTYFKDNALLGALLENPDSTLGKQMKLFMDNFSVSLFGGVQQVIGDVYKEGKTFKGADERSLYILNILSFMERQTLVAKDGTTIQTYSKSYHQLEATQTNFLVSALYQSFMTKEIDKKHSSTSREVVAKGRTTYESATNPEYNNKYLKIVEDLESVVKQEFNRIKKEWARRAENKRLFESGEKNRMIDKFNGKLNSDNVTADTESSGLRAYKFNVLSDFFDANAELTESLIDAAKAGELDFDNLDKTQLLEALNDFALESFDMHLQKLEGIGLIERKEHTDPLKNVIPYYVSAFLPKTIKGAKGKKDTVQSLYPASLGVPDALDEGRVEALLFDNFMNFWRNSLHVNQIMDGDIAMNIKNFQDYVKRLKKVVAAGDTMKKGTHRVAFMNTITAFVHEQYPMYGPYTTEAQIENDWKIEDENVRQILIEDFKIAKADPKSSQAKMIREIFDGQTISSLMHQMDQFDTTGRLDATALNILIAKHYRELTKEEVDYLKSLKIVLNAKKTVTAGPNSYIKSSESYIDRNDVSYIVMPLNATDEQIKGIYDQLHSLYLKVYSLRQDIQVLKIDDKMNTQIADLESELTTTIQQIHSFYKPLPHREMMHDMINAMEYNLIDQLADTSASKNATLLPLDVFNAQRVNGYINLALSSVEMNNNEKFFQVETSGVKDVAKVSVQKKVLLPADVSPGLFQKLLEADAVKSGIPLTESELSAISSMETAFNNYQDSLKKVVDGRLEYFREVLRDGSDFEVGKIFDIIRENLDAQGAPKNMLDFFSTDAAGKPVFSPNLPIVRTTLEYYFMSQYSKNVTDEKASGFKNFHESQFGYEVLEDTETGKVITTEDIRRSPATYSDRTRYKARPLTTSIEVDPVTGQKIYWVEAIMPKPFFENKAHQDFYMEQLNKMFGVRIPTEDKRSMVAIKVVDFSDSAKMNNIIVPHFVHLLSGSDFDIDSLFGQMLAFYRNGSGQYSVYGDYSKYSNERTGKLIEFLHFMSQDSDLKTLIKSRKSELRESGSVSIYEGSPLLEIIRGLGFTQQELEDAFNLVTIQSTREELKNEIQEVYELKEEAKAEFAEIIRETEENPLNQNAWEIRKELGKEIADFHAEMKDMRKQRNELYERQQRARNLMKTVIEYQSMIDVFTEMGIPVTAADFAANPSFEKMVVSRFQNDNLKASLDILTNEALFNRLYINQRSSTKAFEDLLDMFGIKLDQVTQKGNLYTIDHVVGAKVENSMNKDGIGITAVMNKFLALASQFELELSDKQTIWRYNDAEGNPMVFKNFGSLNLSQERTIALIGNILGMFADGAKVPIPSALQWNEINAGTTLNMIGLGLDPAMAVAFNFIPEIKRASLAVQQSKFAISQDANESYLFFNNAVKNELTALLNQKPEVMTSLIGKGLLDPKSWSSRLILNTSEMTIDFKPGQINYLDLTNNVLTTDQIGFTLKDPNNVQLTEDETKVMLLAMYQRQAQQSWSINKVARMTNMFKRLNPTLAAFDRMKDAILYAMDQERGLFTEESVMRMFDNKVWRSMYDVVVDLDNQASKIFLERTPFFRPIVNTFSAVFKDKKKIAEVITGYMSINKYLRTYPGSRKSKTESGQAMINEDDANLLKTFTPDYWFTHGLGRELDRMKEIFPDNEFLKILKVQRTGNTANVEVNGKLYTGVAETYLKVFNKAKIRGKYAEDVVTDLEALYDDERSRMFVKKLFYHELARTGMGNAVGSFLQYMPAELLAPVSSYVESFISGIRSTVESIKENTTAEEATDMIISTIKEFMGKEASNNDVYNFFDEMLMQIAYSAAKEPNNSAIQRVANLSVKHDAKNDGKFTPGVVKKMPSYEQNPYQAVADAKKLIGAIISKANIPDNQTIYVLDPGVLGEEITFDFAPKNYEGQEYQGSKIALASKLGFGYDQESGEFEFPPLMKIGLKTYIIKGVDTSTENVNLGKTMIDAIVGTTPFTMYGMKVVYTEVPDIYASNDMSIAGFNKESARRYKELIAKKATVKMGNAPVSTEEAPKPANANEVNVAQSPKASTTAREFTPDNLNKSNMPVNGIFVFGSNEGSSTGGPATHGTGAAKTARQLFGAIQGQSRGLQGQSYALVTKKFWDVKKSSTLPEIGKEIQDMLLFAKTRPDLKFYVTKIGTENAGYTEQEIKEIFEKLAKFIPDNVILPEVFEIRDSIPAAPQDVSEKPSSVNTEDPALPNAAELASTSALLSSLITPDDTKKDTEMENEAEGEIDLSTGQDVSADFLANVLSLSQGISSSVMSTPDAPLQVYSDGSDIKGTGKLGFGAVFEFKGKEYTISGTEVSPEVRQLSAKHPEAKFSNPTMEMLALVTALNSFKNTKEHIQINQDYKGAVNYGALWYYSEGSEQRESKPWNAKEPYIRTLVDAATTLIKQIEANGGSVKLKWVRGHAGNVMNEKADAAAKNRDIINTFKQATLEHGAEIIKPPGRPGIDLSDQDNCG